MKELKPENVKYIVVHCSASKEGNDIGAREIHRIHLKRGFSMNGYHRVHRLDGTIENGRPLYIQGAHVKGINDESIGVVYIGGLDKDGKPKDTRTDAQLISMANDLVDLKRQFPNAKVVGHRDLSPDLNGNGKVESHEYMKQCPCFNAIDEYSYLNV